MARVAGEERSGKRGREINRRCNAADRTDAIKTGPTLMTHCVEIAKLKSIRFEPACFSLGDLSRSSKSRELAQLYVLEQS